MESTPTLRIYIVLNFIENGRDENTTWMGTAHLVVSGRIVVLIEPFRLSEREGVERRWHREVGIDVQGRTWSSTHCTAQLQTLRVKHGSPSGACSGWQYSASTRLAAVVMELRQVEVVGPLLVHQ